MKALKWIAGISGGVCVLFLAASLTLAAVGGGFAALWDSVKDSGVKTGDTLTVPMNGITRLDLDIDAADITLTRKAQEEATITYTAVGFTGRQGVEAKANNGTLTIRSRIGDRWHWFDRWKMEVEVILPESFTGDLKVDADAGTLTLAAGQTFGAVELDVSAATVRMDGLTARTVDAEVDAGKLTGTGLTADRVSLEVGAGSVKLKELTAAVKAGVDAGSIHLEFARMTGDSTADVSMGSIDILLPADTGAALNLTADMGHVTQKFGAAFSGKSGGNRVEGTLNGGGVKLTGEVDMGNLSVGPLT